MTDRDELADRLTEAAQRLDGITHPVYEYCVDCDALYIIREDEYLPDECFDHTTIGDSADGVRSWLACLRYLQEVEQ